jgi:hypothetical protein
VIEHNLCPQNADSQLQPGRTGPPLESVVPAGRIHRVGRGAPHQPGLDRCPHTAGPPKRASPGRLVPSGRARVFHPAVPTSDYRTEGPSATGPVPRCSTTPNESPAPQGLVRTAPSSGANHDQPAPARDNERHRDAQEMCGWLASPPDRYIENASTRCSKPERRRVEDPGRTGCAARRATRYQSPAHPRSGGQPRIWHGPKSHRITGGSTELVRGPEES